jgi:hypothetical protein|tara:strand:+ start:2054 stop:2470 length:417 start_codon:yes stop_codon:yes gene_type:complete
MSKINIDEVESVLLQKKIEPTIVQSILKELNQIVEEIANDKDTTPKQKWEHVIVLNDTKGEFKGKELTGWVVQQHENDDAGLIISKLQDAAKNQNEGATKKKSVLTSLTDIFGYLKSKFLKEKNIRIKTKEPVRVLIA